MGNHNTIRKIRVTMLKVEVYFQNVWAVVKLDTDMIDVGIERRIRTLYKFGFLKDLLITFMN